MFKKPFPVFPSKYEYKKMLELEHTKTIEIKYTDGKKEYIDNVKNIDINLPFFIIVRTMNEKGYVWKEYVINGQDIDSITVDHEYKKKEEINNNEE